MMRLILAAVMIFQGATAAWTEAPAALNSLHAVHSLTNSQASQALPVAFEATVTYYRSSDIDLFVQDGNAAIYVSFKPGAALLPGDRVLISGKTEDSFRPMVDADSVTFIRHGIAPVASPASFDQLVSAQLDCMRIKVRAVVRSADVSDSGERREVYLQMLMDGGYIDAAVDSKDTSILKGLLDAEVEITGIATAKFDQRMELNGARIDVQGLQDIKILKRAALPVEAVPAAPLDNILGAYRLRDLSKRVRVQGTITYYQPGSTVVLQSGSKSLWVMTLTKEPLRIGDMAEASGFPEVRNNYTVLALAEVRDLQVQAPVAPIPITWRELGFGGNAFKVVATEGRVVRQVREAAIDEYVLESEGHIFSAIYRHPPESDWVHAPAMKIIPVGSTVRATGIGMFYTPDPFNGPMASDILLRSADDIAVVAGPSWLNVRTLLFIAAVLFIVVLIVATRGWTLESRMRRQTVAMAARVEAEAAIERRRSRILEDINGTEPLADILEEIVDMVAFQMEGAYCWCEVVNGARLGKMPPEEEEFRVVQKELASRSGEILGSLYSAFDPSKPPQARESESLLLGVRLAVLAIDARKLHEELLHRSEFDQLTDIPNRFVLDKQLEVRIAEAHQNALIFGLIYIDLDGFKQINDLHGHSVGDSYLQEVALRMKRQLRSQDLLARFGGDEFVALIPQVRSRAGIEEVAQRMERCFDFPVVVEGHTLHGSASFGIAVYPEDATSCDGLLIAADAAMYALKNAKGHTVAGLTDSPENTA